MTMLFTIAQSTPVPFLSDAVFRILGFALLAGLTAGISAILYRWYSGLAIPDGVAVLFGVSVVAIWLNTQSALGAAIIGDTELLEPITAIYTIAVFASSAILSDGGRRLGDYVATNMITIGATSNSLDDMGDLVRTVGRTTAITLPDSIDDAAGYDPVPEHVKTAAAGTTLHVPRNLTKDQMEAQIAKRLRRDFEVGYVEVTLDPDGTVEDLALGSVPAGIGPTLAPGSIALAIEADPSPDASPGDSVRIWRHDGDRIERLTTGEVRNTHDDVVTLSVGEAARSAFGATSGDYRLVTLPGTIDAGREFISLLYSTNASVEELDIDSSSPLVGRSAASLPVTTLVIKRGDSVIALPSDEELQAHDTLFAMARPAGFDALESYTKT
ncbi:MAG: TrkA C-terminal domain-containing protein [Natrialbaceae archaeon]|nr:TrkA C-terminal domain-containing protein [Natrialbaceae archaeon]